MFVACLLSHPAQSTSSLLEKVVPKQPARPLGRLLVLRLRTWCVFLPVCVFVPAKITSLFDIVLIVLKKSARRAMAMPESPPAGIREKGVPHVHII